MTESEAIYNLKLTKHIRIFIPSGEVLEMAIQALEEIQEYRAIGTAEEFKALKEKETPKKPIKRSPNFVPFYACPVCDKEGIRTRQERCDECGQLFYWE